MNTETGRIVTEKELQRMSAFERAKYIPVTRDLSAKERADMQIRKYAPCGCGSGKKFKFCCYKGDN
jgi:uncharacterized protein YchJ